MPKYRQLAYACPKRRGLRRPAGGNVRHHKLNTYLFSVRSAPYVYEPSEPTAGFQLAPFFTGLSMSRKGQCERSVGDER